MKVIIKETNERGMILSQEFVTVKKMGTYGYEERWKVIFLLLVGNKLRTYFHDEILVDEGLKDE